VLQAPGEGVLPLAKIMPFRRRDARALISLENNRGPGHALRNLESENPKFIQKDIFPEPERYIPAPANGRSTRSIFW
jgi:hypothetical protein